jgi:hypothetical protein
MAHHVWVRSPHRDGDVRPDGLRRDRLVDFGKRGDCRTLRPLLSRNPKSLVLVAVRCFGCAGDDISVHGMVQQVRIPGKRFHPLGYSDTGLMCSIQLYRIAFFLGLAFSAVAPLASIARLYGFWEMISFICECQSPFHSDHLPHDSSLQLPYSRPLYPTSSVSSSMLLTSLNVSSSPMPGTRPSTDLVLDRQARRGKPRDLARVYRSGN